jgi:putative tryptophan/tyrosine transport system substrate-binding protein
MAAPEPRGAAMRRREFIGLLGGAALAVPDFSGAQERVPKIGMLSGYSESDPAGQASAVAFREGLKQLGWVEGRNVHVETRWAAADTALLQQFAKELVAIQPDLILSANTPTTAALLQETRTIPIVFANVSDPVGDGFLASLARPGGNVTGFSNMEASMAGKWVELLKEIAPSVTKVTAMFNPDSSPGRGAYFLGPMQSAAASFGIQVVAAPVRDKATIESVLAELARQPDGGLIVTSDIFLVGHRVEITSLAARHRIPAIYPFRMFAEVGGLVSYGSDLIDNYRRAAAYADRILKGGKPNELPVQAPVKFELVVNLKTARALNISVPLPIQQRANEMIE